MTPLLGVSAAQVFLMMPGWYMRTWKGETSGGEDEEHANQQERQELQQWTAENHRRHKRRGCDKHFLSFQ